MRKSSKFLIRCVEMLEKTDFEEFAEMMEKF